MITGASMGIGEALAYEFSKRGANLLLVARSADKLNTLGEKIKLQNAGTNCLAIPCDLADPEKVEALGRKISTEFTSLDGIVFNAGIGIYGEFETLPESDIRSLFEVNFFSILTLLRHCLPLLKKGTRPTILLVSTVISWRAIPRLSPYCASKGALNLFAEAIRVELKPHGIRVVNSYPGRTHTGFTENAKTTGWKPFPTSHRGMSAEKVARKLVRAYLKGKREEYVSLGNRLLIWLNFYFPKLIDWGLERYFRDR